MKKILSPLQILQTAQGRDALLLKIATDLLSIHQKFLDKVEEAGEIINKRVGPKGDKGDKPTREELLSIILPLIPIVRDGKTPTREEIQSLIPVVQDGKTPTQEELLSIIKPLIPKVNIEKIAKLVSAMVKASLPEPIDIEELLKGKKFEVKDINGLEETLKAVKNQTRQGYLHGGGVPSLSAGTNVTLTPKNDGGFTISVAGAGTWYEDEVPSGLKNGINVTYTLAHTPTTVVFLFLNGQRLISGTDYTRVGAIITMITAPLSTDTLTATYS